MSFYEMNVASVLYFCTLELYSVHSDKAVFVILDEICMTGHRVLWQSEAALTCKSAALNSKSALLSTAATNCFKLYD